VLQGSTVTNNVTGVEQSGGAKYICTGWTGTGIAPASGAGTQAVYAVANNATQIWNWATHYLLTTAADPGGMVDVGSGWHPHGTVIAITASATNPGFYFAGWRGDTNGATIASNQITVVMNQARTVIAGFNSTNDLLLYYSFDINRGAYVWDESGNGHTGDVFGATWIHAGAKGAAYSFDGVDDHILATLSNGLSGSFTMSCWAKTYGLKSVGDGDAILVSDVPSYNNYWATIFGYRIPGQFRGQMYDGTHQPVSQSTSSFLSNQWYLITMVRDIVEDKVKIYINGQFEGQGVDDTTLVPAYSRFFIGNQTDRPDRQFRGAIDEVRVYNRALASNEVGMLYNSYFTKYYTLTIDSPYGTPTPPTGSYSHVENTVLTNSVTTPDNRGTTEYVCRGWAMEGNTPVAGSSNVMTMQLTNDAHLVWLWDTNVWLAITSGVNGSVTGATNGWYAFGSSVTLSAQPGPGCAFAGWFGDVPPALAASNPVTLTMDQPRSISAAFNSLPAIAIVAPANGAMFPSFGNIPVAATANDTDHGVRLVAFYVNGDPLGLPDSTSPYDLTWYNVPPGTYTLTAQAWDNVGASAMAVPVTITVSGSAPWQGQAWAATGMIEAENFDQGGEGQAYHDTTAANEGGAYRPAEGVDIAAHASASNGHLVGWCRASEWLNFTINVASAGLYTVEARVACLGAGGAFHFELDGTNVTGSIPIPNTGGWFAWQIVSKVGVALPAGVHALRLVMESVGASGCAGNFDAFQFVPYVAPARSPFGGVPFALPGCVEVENFDNGGEAVAYHDTTSANEGGAYRAAEGVDIAAHASASNGHCVGWVRAGEWLEYTINVVSAGVYTLDARVACAGAGGRFHVEINGTHVTGAINVPNTGDWFAWQTVSQGGITLAAGQQILRLAFDTHGLWGCVGNFDRLRFTATSLSAPSAGKTEGLHSTTLDAVEQKNNASSLVSLTVAKDRLLPYEVLTSDDAQDQPSAGWAAADGDSNTIWCGNSGMENWWLSAGYIEPFDLRNVRVDLAEDSLTNLMLKGSLDATNWFDFNDTLTRSPLPAKYLWFIIKADETERMPRIKEIRVEGNR
jgi:hypothetical protein